MVKPTKREMRDWTLYQAWIVFSIWVVYFSGCGHPQYSGHSEITLLGFLYFGPLIFIAFKKILLTFRSPALRVGVNRKP